MGGGGGCGQRCRCVSGAKGEEMKDFDEKRDGFLGSSVYPIDGARVVNFSAAGVSTNHITANLYGRYLDRSSSCYCSPNTLW